MKFDCVILDGRHLLWRTSDAFKQLEAEVDGETIPTGGVYGFLNCALRVRARYGGRCVVAWDGPRNFRLKLYPSYKGKDQPLDAERLELIQEMAAQESVLRTFLTSLGVDQYTGLNCEADDVIGRLAGSERSRGRAVAMYSGDSDLRQLVCPGVIAVAPERGRDKLYDESAVEARHGVPPRLLAQLKALSGDSSDKIPGAPGIGPVTAAKLLNHYGSLSKVLAAAEAQDPGWPDTKRRLDAVAGSVGLVRRFYALTKIRTDMPWKVRRGRRDQGAVVEMIKKYRFRSFASALELRGLMNLGQD